MRKFTQRLIFHFLDFMCATTNVKLTRFSCFTSVFRKFHSPTHQTSFRIHSDSGYAHTSFSIHGNACWLRGEKWNQISTRTRRNSLRRNPLDSSNPVRSHQRDSLSGQLRLAQQALWKVHVDEFIGGDVPICIELKGNLLIKNKQQTDVRSHRTLKPVT